MTPQITKMEERLRDLVGGGWYKNGKRIPLPTDTSKIIYGETLKFIQSELTLAIQEQRKKDIEEFRGMIKSSRLPRQPKYDGNDLRKACKEYGIGANNWTEVVRFEMGNNFALDQLNSQLTIKKEE